FHRFDDPALPAQTHDLIGGVLACRAKLAGSSNEEADWRSYHFSMAAAHRLYQQRAGDLSRYPLHSEDRGWSVTVNQEEIPCGWVD
ncbi:MAG TPA: hypothetical protein PKD55_24520, partial [Bellilinea sp.]|nr:hypothetical protein [Bellilinea sp.]